MNVCGATQASYPCGSLEGQAGLGGWDQDAPYFNHVFP